VENHLRIYQLTQQLQERNCQLQDEITKRRQAEGQLARADDQLSMISEQEIQRWGIKGFVGRSPTISAILSDVRRLQQADKTAVLIMGESGTGKELIARAIHFGSSRSQRPFIVVNCSAIPRELAESILFGHVRGAFTGAHVIQKGYFERADGGTLFLDEIGDMPLELQPKLLRVLEDGTFIPIGATEVKRTDVRVLSATNQDLRNGIAQKGFRQDLYFRLAQFTVLVPPLRNRPEDIPLLVDHFMEMFSAEMGKTCPNISNEALDELKSYSFPGNVRELKNIIEHAFISSGGASIQPEHLHLLDDPDTPVRPAGPSGTDTSNQAEKDFEQLLRLIVKRAQKKPSQKQESGQDQSVAPMTDEEKILAYVNHHGSINNTECRQLLSSNYYHASYLLKKLHGYGLLKRDGEGRWTRYCLPFPSAMNNHINTQ